MTLIAKYTSEPYVYSLGGLLTDIFTNVHYNSDWHFSQKITLSISACESIDCDSGFRLRHLKIRKTYRTCVIACKRQNE